MNDSKTSKRSKRENAIGFVAKLMGETLLCMLLLCFVGMLVSWKIDVMLNQTMEESTVIHAQSVAYGTMKKFRQELDSLENCSELISIKDINMDDIIRLQNKENSPYVTGMMNLEGQTISGKALPAGSFAKLSAVFRGEQKIAVLDDGAMVFAVPVYHGDRVQYILYRYYEQDRLSDRFGNEDADELGALIVCEKDTGRLVIPYHNFQEADPVFNMDGGIPLRFRAIRSALEDKSSIASYLEQGQNQYFLFGADIQGTDLIVLGYVERARLAADMERIHKLSVWIFGLLLLLFAVFSLYTFMARLRARESDELREAKAAADQANRAKSDFLANMSHEIRTPINAVLGMNEMIMRESHEEGIRKYAWNIKSASETLLSLINDILDFSKIESGKMEIVDGEYQLSSLLNDVVNMIKVKAEQKQLKFGIRVDADLPDSLFGDEVRIKQVIVNILNNAVKYTREGSVTFGVGGRRQDSGVTEMEFTVKDTGIGIREEDKAKLFTHFERLDLQKNRHIEGTGLGLAITLSLVKQMQGTIQVDSVYGKGSTFTIRLPQKVMAEDKIGNFEERVEEFIRHQQHYQESFRAPEADIMVVDDNEMNLFVVESLLKQTQIRITRCGSGRDCLKKMTEKHYDVIFLDHMMPDMDGIETFRESRRLTGSLCLDTPVIALTANAITGVKEMFLKNGFTDYLSKPIDSRQLERMLQKYLPEEKVLPADTDDTVAGPGVPAGASAGGLPAPTETKGMEGLPAWLISIADLNPAAGVRNCGSVNGYMEALRIFYTALSDGAAEIERYFGQEDWHNYTVKVHALKSTARIIGATQLSEQARQLEALGHQEDISALKRLTPELLTLYRSYQSKLAPLQPELESGRDKPILAADQAAEAYATIKELAGAFDLDSILFVLKSLADYRLQAEDRLRYEQLKAAAEKPDWDELNRVLK